MQGIITSRKRLSGGTVSVFVCGVTGKSPLYIHTRVENPHTTPASRMTSRQPSSFSSLSEDPSFCMQSGVKWLKHRQKGRSCPSCNAWTHSFLNTIVQPTLLSIRNTGLEEASRNHLHHSLLRQGKHYLDIKGISPDCSTVSSITTIHPPAFFYYTFSSSPSLIWIHTDKIIDYNLSAWHIFYPDINRLAEKLLSHMHCSLLHSGKSDMYTV